MPHRSQVLVATQEVAAGTTAADASEDGAFETPGGADVGRREGALTDITIISDQVALATDLPRAADPGADVRSTRRRASGLQVPKGQARHLGPAR